LQLSKIHENIDLVSRPDRKTNKTKQLSIGWYDTPSLNSFQYILMSASKPLLIIPLGSDAVTVQLS